jgi:membrane fusion protein (multidrug efflux system)
MQDKILVFTVSNDNKVLSKPITVSDKIGNYYVVADGLKAGDRVVFAGLDRLKDSTTIKPQLLSMDSLLKANPLHL